MVGAEFADKDRRLVEDVGADQLVRELYPDGVDGLLDGAVQNALTLPAVKDGGDFATIRYWEGPSERGIAIHRVAVSEDYHADGKLDRLRRLVEDGVRGRLVLTYD